MDLRLAPRDWVCSELTCEVGKRGFRTPHGIRIDKKHLYRMLSNRAYVGEAVHRGDSYLRRAGDKEADVTLARVLPPLPVERAA